MKSRQMPPLRTYKRRLKAAHKAIKIEEDLLLPSATAKCLTSWLRRNGMKTVTRTEGAKIRVWRAS